jgi:hypothetical protein
MKMLSDLCNATTFDLPQLTDLVKAAGDTDSESESDDEDCLPEQRKLHRSMPVAVALQHELFYPSALMPDQWRPHHVSQQKPEGAHALGAKLRRPPHTCKGQAPSFSLVAPSAGLQVDPCWMNQSQISKCHSWTSCWS